MNLGQLGEIQNDAASEDILMSDAVPQINVGFDPSEAYITPVPSSAEHSYECPVSHSKTCRLNYTF